MKNCAKITAVLLGGTMLFGLSACGDEITTEQIVNGKASYGSFESRSDLPDCTEENAGQTVFVKDSNEFYGCNGEEWMLLNNTTASVGDNVCSSVALPNDGGFKIICNGDSIGVIRNGIDGVDGEKGKDGIDGKNGKDGAAGDAGAGCSIVSPTESDDSVTVVKIACGSETFELDLSAKQAVSSSGEECADDDEECVPMDSVKLSGASQKGPFVNGADVTAYELLNGRTLKQTGKTFGGKIQSDDGSFNIKSVKLSSQYAYLVADGYYLNEVSGQQSSSSIKLRALTNLKGRSKANINLITHLEYDRVHTLVTKESMKVYAAKKQAEKEIFEAFGINSEKFTGLAEDLNVLQEGDGNAALLAISILLQGKRTEAQLTAILASLSVDLGDDGIWGNLTDRVNIADWAMEQDLSKKGLQQFRDNVIAWGIEGTKVPAFEKYFREFWQTELNIPQCNEANEGVVKSIPNSYSKYYAQSDSVYNENSDKSKMRLICDASTKLWREASDLEKDTYGIKNAQNGHAYLGLVNASRVYVYDENEWRVGSNLDLDDSLKACTNKRAERQLILQSSAMSDTSWYKCTSGLSLKIDNQIVTTAWRKAVAAEADTVGFQCAFIGQLVKGVMDSSNIYYCENAEANKWRRASDTEIDFYDFDVNKPLSMSVYKDGAVHHGLASKKYYVYDADELGWREETSVLDHSFELNGCTHRRSIAYNSDGTECTGEWKKCMCNDTVCWDTDYGTTVPEDAGFTFPLGIGNPRGEVKIGTDNVYYLCIDNMWRKASDERIDTYLLYYDDDFFYGKALAGKSGTYYYHVADADSFRLENASELWARETKNGGANFGSLCSEKEGVDYTDKYGLNTWLCKKGIYEWDKIASRCEKQNADVYDTTNLNNRGHKLTMIGNQVWLAENYGYVNADKWVDVKPSWTDPRVFRYSHFGDVNFSDPDLKEATAQLNSLEKAYEKLDEEYDKLYVTKDSLEQLGLGESELYASVSSSISTKLIQKDDAYLALNNYKYGDYWDAVKEYELLRLDEIDSVYGALFVASQMEDACKAIQNDDGLEFHWPSSSEWKQMLGMLGTYSQGYSLKSREGWGNYGGSDDFYLSIHPSTVMIQPQSCNANPSYAVNCKYVGRGISAIYLTSDNQFVVFDRDNRVTITASVPSIIAKESSMSATRLIKQSYAAFPLRCVAEAYPLPPTAP